MVSKNIIWLSVDSLCCHIHPGYLCCETSTLLTSLLFCVCNVHVSVPICYSIRLLILRLAIKWCAVRGYRLPFTWFVPACLPPFTALWWWVLLVYYVLREMWTWIDFCFISFFLYFFAYTIMCAFPMYYVSRTTKTPKQQKKTPVERKISLFL